MNDLVRESYIRLWMGCLLLTPLSFAFQASHNIPRHPNFPFRRPCQAWMDCFPSQATFCWSWPCLCWSRLWFISSYPSHQTSSQLLRRDLLASGRSDRWASGACWLLCPTYLRAVSPHLHLLFLLPAVHHPVTKINSHWDQWQWFLINLDHSIGMAMSIISLEALIFTWGSFDLDIGYVDGVPHLLLA